MHLEKEPTTKIWGISDASFFLVVAQIKSRGNLWNQWLSFSLYRSGEESRC